MEAIVCYKLDGMSVDIIKSRALMQLLRDMKDMGDTRQVIPYTEEITKDSYTVRAKHCGEVVRLIKG